LYPEYSVGSVHRAKSCPSLYQPGACSQEKRHWDRAIADFDEAIRLKPDFVSTLNNWANTFYVKGQFGRAIADFDEAIRLNPKFAEAYGNRGNIYRKRGIIDQAIRDYDKASS
jgi:tetratricopeptide (TPR) repeat protein